MREFHKMWLAGFLTGVGLVYSITQRLEVTADVDVEGAAAWIEKHCREYPLDPFAKAVNLLAAHIVNRARPADAQQQAAPENR